MADVLQHRKGSIAGNDLFTGALAEISIDIESKSLRVHDGAKQGGYEVGMPQAKGIIDLRSHIPTASAFRYLKYNTTQGDGGHGVFRAVTGAAIGTYVNNNTTIIVPTGGNGSAAWVREAQAGAAAQVAAGLGASSKRADGSWSKKAVSLPINYSLQTWVDTLVAGVLYDVLLTAPQNGLPAGWWYIEVLRHSNDFATSQMRVIRATAFGTGGTPNLVYQSTCTVGSWTPFIKAVMNKPLVWITPTLINGWTVYASGAYAPVKYAKDDSGVVYVVGLVAAGSNNLNTDIFTLPVGYRPEYEQIHNNQASNGDFRVDVTPGGLVQAVGIEIHTGNATFWLDIHMVFKAA